MGEALGLGHGRACEEEVVEEEEVEVVEEAEVVGKLEGTSAPGERTGS